MAGAPLLCTPVVQFDTYVIMTIRADLLLVPFGHRPLISWPPNTAAVATGCGFCLFICAGNHVDGHFQTEWCGFNFAALIGRLKMTKFQWKRCNCGKWDHAHILIFFSIHFEGQKGGGGAFIVWLMITRRWRSKIGQKMRTGEIWLKHLSGWSEVDGGSAMKKLK